MLRSPGTFLVALLSISPLAPGAQVCRTASVSVMPVNWNQPLAVPRFDSSFGTLVAVHVQFGFAANMTLSRPDNSVILTAIPAQNLFFTLAPYDGVLDLAGPSGISMSGLSVDLIPAPTVTLNTATDLAMFTGPTGNPGTALVTASAQGASFASGPGSLGVVLTTMRASCSVTVCYAYSPPVTTFCFGTNAACPCANGGFNSSGCANSAITWGAGLVADGTPSVSVDTLSLNAANMPANASTLFFQGTTRVNGGLGTPFGDGLRCAGGTITRLGVKTAVAGVANYPAVGDMPISLRGGVSAGDVRMHQAWFRDVANYCTADTFNLTQGVEVRWVM